MTPERIAELHHAAAESGLPGDGTEVLAECLDEIDRLRGWIAWIDIHCNRTGWYGVESALFKARNGEKVPS